MNTTTVGLRYAVLFVALLNLGYFGIEFTVATKIGSVSLFADSIDFLEDASLNLLVLMAVGWSAVWRARVGMLLALLLMAPAVATVWTAWHKIIAPVAPSPSSLTVTALGALAVNLICAFILAFYRKHSGSLTHAAFLSARNDAFANIAIIVAGLTTSYIWRSAWPDIIVGIAITYLNADAAHKVWRVARQEHRAART